GLVGAYHLAHRARRLVHNDGVAPRRQEVQQPERHRSALGRQRVLDRLGWRSRDPGMVGEDMQRQLDIQAIFRLTPQGEVRLTVDDTVYPNGLCFSPDESILYVNDTRLGLIRAFDVNADGSVRNARAFHKLTGAEPGVADGMKCDRDGNVYCTGPGG